MYKIYFIDGTTFVDKNDITNSKWDNIPNKLIKRIDYELYGIKLKLDNFESYNHLIKHANVIIGRKFNGVVEVIMLAKQGENIRRFVYNLINSEFKEEIVNIDFQPSSGWKEGIKGKIPTYKINP